MKAGKNSRHDDEDDDAEDDESNTSTYMHAIDTIILNANTGHNVCVYAMAMRWYWYGVPRAPHITNAHTIIKFSQASVVPLCFRYRIRLSVRACVLCVLCVCGECCMQIAFTRLCSCQSHKAQTRLISTTTDEISIFRFTKNTGYDLAIHSRHFCGKIIRSKEYCPSSSSSSVCRSAHIHFEINANLGHTVFLYVYRIFRCVRRLSSVCARVRLRLCVCVYIY